MEIQFWGTRGSISTPSENHLKYGGNTACIEINDGKNSIILDAGYGLVGLGNKIMRDSKNSKQKKFDIFLTHMHWDHIQGLPFFIPIFIRGFTIGLHGNSTYSKSLKEIIANQFSLNYSPIGSLDMLGAELEFIEMMAGDLQKIGPFHVEPFDVPHSSACFGFKINHGKKTIVYTGDCDFADGMSTKLTEKISGADIIIHDAYHFAKDYERFASYGHGSMERAILNAINANIKHVVLFHYSPDYNDSMIDKEVKILQKKYKSKIIITPAQEGKVIKL